MVPLFRASEKRGVRFAGGLRSRAAAVARESRRGCIGIIAVRSRLEPLGLGRLIIIIMIISASINIITIIIIIMIIIIIIIIIRTPALRRPFLARAPWAWVARPRPPRPKVGINIILRVIDIILRVINIILRVGEPRAAKAVRT